LTKDSSKPKKIILTPRRKERKGIIKSDLKVFFAALREIINHNLDPLFFFVTLVN
jgi:hypothetical protein